jgi:hypothetical protein
MERHRFQQNSTLGRQSFQRQKGKSQIQEKSYDQVQKRVRGILRKCFESKVRGKPRSKLQDIR